MRPKQEFGDANPSSRCPRQAVGITRPWVGTGGHHRPPAFPLTGTIQPHRATRGESRAFRTNQGWSRHGRDRLGPPQPWKTREVVIKRHQRPAVADRQGRDVSVSRQVSAGSALQEQALQMEPVLLCLHNETHVRLGQPSRDVGTGILDAQGHREDRRSRT